MTALHLVDIQDVKVNPMGTLEEKARSFLGQIQNPYRFRYGKYEVTIDFVGDERLEDKLIGYLSKK